MDASYRDIATHVEVLTEYYQFDAAAGMYTDFGLDFIQESAFADNRRLIFVAISKSINEIREAAFIRCRQLEWVYVRKIRNGTSLLQRIGPNAFYDCDQLTVVGLPKGLSCIQDGAFGRCRSLREISIPSTVNVIGNAAFKECTSLADFGTEGRTRNDS